MSSHMKTNDSDDKSRFQSNLNIIRQIEFFSGVSIEVMKLFALLCKSQSYKSGDVIFSQDEDDHCSYYILSGQANLVLKNKGKEYIIREYKEEHFFGVLSLITPMVKQFSLVTTQDTTCLTMTREAFSKVVDQFPQILLTVTRSIGQRVVMAERKSILEIEENDMDTFKNLLGISLI